ncbi:dienelactone hydrolase [Podospora appendiculata]|uniref:Dienelactone hydrolase n=1 Tax=Podospora appendiculata TaxID=314037 RepID=A0AAE1CE62_9PEZI|nr:dienelactone hydrolase [Podospora appendiculata]
MADAEFIAQPPGPCCFVGTIHQGTPRGKIEKILNVPTYIARPAEDKSNGHVVFYFPDVWGLSNNASLLMDGFADAGYLTLGMDYFNGDPISKYRPSKNDPLPEGFDLGAWRTKHSTFAAENVPKWAAAVREKFGSERTKYACVGYCFGAPYVCNMLATDHVSAGAFAHPTFLKEENFTPIKHPLLLSCAEHDHAFNTEARRKAIDVLQRDKKVYHLQLFYGVGHGFATKADLDDPYQLWCKDQSLKGIIDWFDLWLVRS